MSFYSIFSVALRVGKGMLERKTLSVNGIIISYLAGGAGPAIVFLHGWRSEAAVWRHAMESMEGSFAVFAPDLPGFGASGNPPRAFSVADYAEVVKGFLEKLGIKDALIVGHSFGGRIAIVLSVHYPGAVRKLVLVDAAGIRGKSAFRNAIQRAAKVAKPAFSSGFTEPLRRLFYKAIGAQDYLATPELTETFKMVINEDLTPFLKNIGQETLLVWGSEDKDTPVSFAHTMEKEIQASRLEIFRGAGHFSFLDEPEKFSGLVAAFAKNPVSSHIRF
jgi:pimeloyl-ACP methyl ester carboxylesterase